MSHQIFSQIQSGLRSSNVYLHKPYTHWSFTAVESPTFIVGFSWNFQARLEQLPVDSSSNIPLFTNKNTLFVCAINHQKVLYSLTATWTESAKCFNWINSSESILATCSNYLSSYSDCYLILLYYYSDYNSSLSQSLSVIGTKSKLWCDFECCYFYQLFYCVALRLMPETLQTGLEPNANRAGSPGSVLGAFQLALLISSSLSLLACIRHDFW